MQVIKGKGRRRSDGERETLEADPVREPLAEGGGIDALSGPRTVTYTNDALNRLSMDDPNIGTPTIFTPNHLNQYTSVTGHGALNYDGNLNVSGYDGWTFVHDAEKRLLSVTGNGHTAQFVYDGLGRCVKRTIDGAAIVITYDNWKPIVEWEWYAGATHLVAWNLYGPGADEILVRNQPNTGGYLYYHLDPMGNVQFLLGDTQQGLEKYTYDVFGKPTIIGWNGDVRPISSYGNRFLFTGREYLYTFGLYDYRHRIYHPGLGRFIQTDPLGLQIEGAKLSAQQTALYLGGGAPEKFSSSELNLYRYCNNDPINKSDPLGLDPIVVSSAENALALQGDAQNLAAMNANTWIFGTVAFEYGSTVYADSQGKLTLSAPRTDNHFRNVRPPEDPSKTSRVETHVHTFTAKDDTTNSYLSAPDVHRGNQTGRTQQVISPNGVRDRYRPSDNAQERKRGEGGIIERRGRDGEWHRLSGANTDLKHPGAARNGY